MTRWLDFSGAPPLLLPARLIPLWRGAIDPATGRYSDLNMTAPLTDYDRACVAAWPGRGVLPVGTESALVLYTEYDEHTWDALHNLVACGGWLPIERDLDSASWEDSLVWQVQDWNLVLMNSAADGANGLHADEFMEVQLTPGRYVVEYATLESTSVGCFHRFTLAPSTKSTSPLNQKNRR